MKATVTVKGQVLEVVNFVKWEDNHAKYEGSIEMVSKKGTQYIGFVCKNSNKVVVNYVSNFSVRSYGIGVYEGLEIKPCLTESEVLEKAISEKFGIGTKILITTEGICIDLQTIQSASTLLKAFRRHGALIKANDYINYSMFIPNVEPKKLFLS